MDYGKLDISENGSQPQAIAVQKYGKWGIMDRNRKMLTRIDYDNFWSFARYVLVKKGNKYGLLDSTVKELIPAKYDSIGTTVDYTAGKNLLYLNAEVKKKWALLTDKGKALTPFKYDAPLQFRFSGMAITKLNNKFGIVNTAGGEIAPCIYDDIDFRSEAVIIVEIGDKYGVINSRGETIYPCKYSHISSPYGVKIDVN